ncbi:hypothetical protein [Xanthomarina sp. F2636L]|uniref:hypothetical protein n=1 Tax=Xanthomarina sp. F2636L TaxID=2996018 RepID=UPI00225DDBF0|nr:hypothetical protein [Xanthomarina sp. F2636L]MCX7551726.1 hypothetical protein [Xanthomarina sp. F2636L]
MKKLTVLSIVILFFSCNSKKIMVRNPADGNGYIVGAITIINEKPKYSSYGFKFKPEDKDVTWLYNGDGLAILRSSPHLKIDNKKVYLFVLELKVGDYEFYDYNLVTNTGIGYAIKSSKNKFNIPFKVEADAINYIGNIAFFPNYNINDTVILISDNFEEDLGLLKEKYPRKNWQIIQNITLKEGHISNTLIEFE